MGSGIGKPASAPVRTDPAMNNPVIPPPCPYLRRITIAALMAVALLPDAVHAAPETGLRSFTAPLGNEDGRPRPDKAPLVSV